MPDGVILVEKHESEVHPIRERIVSGLSFIEDIVYLGLGALLAVSALALLVSAFKVVAYSLWVHAFAGQLVGLLDQILLVLLIIEVLYTVQVSFREHGLVAEPFLVVALIAVIRRILVITAELPKLPESAEPVFWHAIGELAIFTAMILILVASLIMLQKQQKPRSSS